ncbi:MAG: hypothetical protein IPO64_10220 [Bacteroidetes bacterium]|nr:hypothetical protein [Bacteroidota bacterium]
MQVVLINRLLLLQKELETVVLYIKGNAVDPNPALPITVSEALPGGQNGWTTSCRPKPVVAPAPQLLHQ